MPRLRLDLAYDGTAFSGWAAQPGLRTVEGVLTSAPATILRPDVRLPTAEGERPPLYATTLDLGSELVTVSSPTPFRARIHRFSY